MALLRQFGLLLWKNWLLQKRKVVLTAFEIGIPTVFALIIMLIRQRVAYEVVDDVTTWSSVQINDSLPARLESPLNTWALAYSPNTSLVQRLAGRVGQRLNMRTNGYGFPSEQALVDHMTALNFTTFDILAGVVFPGTMTTLPQNVRYKLRPPAEQYNSRNSGTVRFLSASDWYTSTLYPFSSRVGPREKNDSSGGRPGYYSEGLLSIQRALDLAIIEEVNPSADLDRVDHRLKRHPYPPYVSDPFIAVLQNQFPFIIMLSFIVMAPNICKDVVLEKERKLKESMKLMGLNSGLHWLAWFVKYSLFLLTSILVMTLFFHLDPGSGAMINYTDPSVTIVFLFLYAVATIMLCFAISTFFSKASSGAAAGGIIYLVTYIPFFFMQFRLEDITWQQKMGACIVPNLAMALGCVEMSLAEGIGVGIQWSNINQPVNADTTFTMLYVLLFLVLDIIIYGLLTWYLDAVLPGEFGVTRPFYFPFTKTYWCGQKPSQCEQDDLDYTTVPNIQADLFETVTGATAGIKLRNLRKEFKKNGTKKVAVNDLNLDIYEGQITSILGHNGAGKTTTMFMLTGFLPPSKGTAFVNGLDIRRDIGAVRRSLGLCPQHDILFDTLTVQEHLVFFAKLKGCSDSNLDQEVDHMIDVLNLEEKRHVFAQNLSGGMKRKLSVGIALIAGSKIVILDEPTSGMDPEARRQTWDILQSERVGRTMILSTHFMEEADLLGDRIAIMSHGVVQCCGSSLFLKAKYGVGYHMVMVKESGCQVEGITSVIRQYVPGASVENNVGGELSYVLPQESSANFEELFAFLEENKAELKISSLGASVTTLEEVFLKVGEGEEEEEEDQMPSAISNKVNPATSSPKKSLSTGYVNQSFLPEDQSKGKDNEQVVLRSIEPISYGTATSAQSTTQQAASGEETTVLDEDLTSKGAASVHMTKGTANGTANGVHSAANGTAMSADDHWPSMSSLLAERNSGWRHTGQQFWAMLVKKMIHSRRNLLVTLVQLLVPLFFTIIAGVVIETFPGPRDPPSLDLDLLNWDNTITPYLTRSHHGNSTAAGLSSTFERYSTRFTQVQNASGATDMDSFLNEVAVRNFELFNKEYMVAASFEDVEGNSNYSTRMIGHFNNVAYHVNAIILGMLDNSLLRYFTPDQDYTIEAANHPLPRTLDTTIQDELNTLMAVGFMVSWCVSFGMAFLVGTFVVFIIKERAIKAKHVQFVSGVHVANYWVSTFLWDLINYLVPSLLLFAVFAGFKMTAYIEGNNPGYVFLVFLFYAWSVLPFIYLLSFLFTVASTGYVWITVLNIFTGTAAIMAVVILQYPDMGTEEIGDALEWVFYVLLPNFCFGNALENLYSNHETIQICNQLDEFHDVIDKDIFCQILGLVNFTNPCCPENCGVFCAISQDNYLAWASPGLGRPILFMALQGLIFFFILFLIESGRGQAFCQRVVAGNGSSVDKDEVEVVNMEQVDSSYLADDDDVLAEKRRIEETDLEELQKTDSLILRDIYKYYGRLAAVDGLSVGIARGECFGLLGVNGAGKTSTFKMLTGDETVSAGNGYLEGFDVTTDTKKVQRLIGYCPQFDALIDQMTVRETLRMYARLRGIKEKNINDVIDSLIQQVLLDQHAGKQASQLSGGNKRKLSAAIALVGEPAVVYLDEPTTGMDPAARRSLWGTLSEVRRNGRTLVLTSHSMEECEALCTRMAIMVNGRFRCLGSTQHLKNKFGEGYTLIAKVMTSAVDAGHSMESRMSELQAFITRSFPGAVLKDIHLGFLHYQISSKENSWGTVFGTMERAKKEYHIEDFSVSQTTLDQVFLNFARAQIAPREEGVSCGVKCGNCCRFFCCCGCCRP